MPRYLACVLYFIPACAHLHHAQVGDVDNRSAAHTKVIDVKVSETGFSAREAEFASRHANVNVGGSLGNVFAIVQLFQMGPRTGHPGFDADYAENIVQLLKNECPDGEVTGLQLVREMRRYPIISGEIVKVTGECRDTTAKGKAS